VFIRDLIVSIGHESCEHAGWTWSCISLVAVMVDQGRLSDSGKAKVQGGFGPISQTDARRKSTRRIETDRLDLYLPVDPRAGLVLVPIDRIRSICSPHPK
jgi:hypothetical protein